MMRLKMIRAFLALELPAPIQRNLRLLQEEFSFLAREIKWVEEANLHVTLHFLGSIPAGEVERVCACAAGVAREMGPFTVEIGGLGVFPPHGKTRVFWAGIGRGKEELRKLYTNLGTSLARAGFALESRPYTPHVTLGRFRQPPVAAARLQSAIKQREEATFGSFTAREIALFESILTPGGPIYRVLQQCQLGK
ncbi:MAG TPA: RNA 2',3'-cyclic phosphodiesterase [Firmicutes bacterium]|nr:RNA 2',3'-cyclic phosphodiesterase [Bacillota bacterium]